jgi:hypothetical protein
MADRFDRQKWGDYRLTQIDDRLLLLRGMP